MSGRRAGSGLRARRSRRVRWGRARGPRGHRVGPGKPLRRGCRRRRLRGGCLRDGGQRRHARRAPGRRAHRRAGGGDRTGFVGQLTGRSCRAAGCRVVGIDLDGPRREGAASCGSVDVGYDVTALDARRHPAAGGDCDAVIVTAATRSADPIELAAALLRDRGRVVVVGDAHVEVPRAPTTSAKSNSASRAPTVRGATTASTRKAASTTRSAMSAGRSSATWPRSSIWWPPVASIRTRW